MDSVSQILSEAHGCLEDECMPPQAELATAQEPIAHTPAHPTIPTVDPLVYIATVSNTPMVQPTVDSSLYIPTVSSSPAVQVEPLVTAPRIATTSLTVYDTPVNVPTTSTHPPVSESTVEEPEHSHSSESDSDGEERAAKRRKVRKRGSVMTLSSVDQTTCVVSTCKNRSRDMSMWRNQKCPTHSGKLQGECDCRFNQAFYLTSMKRLNDLHTAMYYELCWDDIRIQSIDAHWKPSKYHKVCSQHFCTSMENYVYSFPILGLNKSRRRIQLIAKKYGLESLLPKDFDTMQLERNMILPQVRVLSGRIVNSSAKQKPFPLRPVRLVGGSEFSNLIADSEDELYGINGTAPPPSLEEAFKSDPRSKRLFLKTEDKTSKQQLLEQQLHQQRADNESLIGYAKRLGCIVITPDDPGMKDGNFKKMKNRCVVEGCTHRLTTKDVFLSLPRNFEVALHCIAVCITSVGGQNMHMTKVIESAKRHKWDEFISKDPTDGSTVRILPTETIEESSLYFCHRHLNMRAIDANEKDPMLKIRPMLTENLPDQKELYSHTGRVAYLLNNRHKIWIDCKMGCEVSKMVPGLTRVPTPSDIAKSQESASSYHCAIPDCWSNKQWMAERVQMFPIPTEEKDYQRWYNCVLSRLGDVHLPKTGFLCAHHFPDSDFLATIPRTFHTVKKKSGLVKCAVRSCNVNETKARVDGELFRLVPLPADAPSRVRWWSQLTAGDPQFGRFVSSQSIFICERHFTNILDPNSIPSLKLGAESTQVVTTVRSTPRLTSEHETHDDRTHSSEVQASDWALPVAGEVLRLLPGGQKSCCMETRAIIAKLSRLFAKSRALMDLVKVLHKNMGVPVPKIDDFDEKADDMKMYGRLASTQNSISIASVITELADAISETRDEITAMKDDANAIGGELGMTLVDALGALGGSFEPSHDKTHKGDTHPHSTEEPPILERHCPAVPPSVVTEYKATEEKMDTS